MTSPPTQFGVDRFLADSSRWRPLARVGLVTNDAARLASDTARYSREALLDAGVPVVRLFGPEHGLGARADDGAPVQDGRDPRTGLPVVSLYGTRLRPAADQLTDLDALLFDIPDVGARFYTYAWTLWHALHACADASVPLVVLDRPNPLGGVLASVEGPLLDPSCRSFIGEDDIPVRHGLTLGELARLWQREHCPSALLEVVPCEHWRVDRAWTATGLPWVPTSPAMPSFSSAMWYPGTCLFEATNLSVGRGTDHPFATVGAPWLKADAVARVVHSPGVRIAPCHFVPSHGPHAGARCTGVRLSLEDVPDPDAFVANDLRPVALGLALLAEIATEHPEQFAWARYPTAANPEGHDHLARLVGRADVVPRLLAPDTRHSSIASLTQAHGWHERVSPITLYPR